MANIPPEVSVDNDETRKEYLNLAEAREKGLKGESLRIDNELTDSAPIDPISEEDKKAFLRSVLGSNRFNKTFKLYGDIEVVFQDLTEEELEELYSFAESREEDNKVKVYDAEFLRRSIVKCEKIPGIHRALKQEYKEFAEAFDALPRPLTEGLKRAANAFQELVDVMIAEGLNENFWEPDGAA